MIHFYLKEAVLIRGTIAKRTPAPCDTILNFSKVFTKGSVIPAYAGIQIIQIHNWIGEPLVSGFHRNDKARYL
ncbi:MAG TPA: hypothetical protein DIV86_03670 [Alphaproteobacteria bacterium]|nr:hypothetical protein [Alphaproteobacteria bacterium]